VNPFSTGVTDALVEEVVSTLERRVDVVVRTTKRRDHARELAAEAAGTADGVVVFSGDGTYNEAINGAAGRIPFGFLPGGGTSVFPRALGLPRNPAAAAALVADAIAEGRTSSISLGRVNGRRFAFSAGIGFDAEAVRRVDGRGRDRQGRRASNLVFVATVVGVMAESRFRMRPQLEIEGFGRAAFVMVANGRPYTYAGPLPVAIAGEADFAAGLDFVAPREIVPGSVPRLSLRAVRGRLAGDRRVLTGHDLDSFRVRCDRPLPLQADGEDLGDVTDVLFESERGTLAVFR